MEAFYVEYIQVFLNYDQQEVGWSHHGGVQLYIVIYREIMLKFSSQNHLTRKA